jgi:hypothetical protein
MRITRPLILAAALFVANGLQASTPVGQVQSFGLNNGLILELYNVAQQNNGVVSSYPAGLNPAVVQATVKNVGAQAGPLCFQIVLQEPGVTCSDTSGASLVWSPVISTKMSIQPGETRSLGAADFETSGSFQGALCSSFEADFKKDFEDVSIEDLPKVVDRLLKRRFQVCLVPVSCGGGSNAPSVSDAKSQCSVLTLFQANPGAQASVAGIIYPHNNGVPSCNLNFLWTPALYPGLSSSEISYTLEVRADGSEEVIARVDVPAGQNFYQWSARDRALEPGQKYWWRVISRKAKNGAPFGGQDGRGWNIQKWFICGEAPGKCRVTLADLDRFVQANAKPEVRDALKGFLVKAITDGQLDDAALCRLINGKAKVNAITVIKK